jgi:hypothetical protein
MTNDDWYGLLVLGSEINTSFTVFYLFTMVYVLNYIIVGLLMAILLDGFSKYMDEEG